jgi:hypothetical protein
MDHGWGTKKHSIENETWKNENENENNLVYFPKPCG